jgi:hypothetical protein
MIHDFVLFNALREALEVKAALSQASDGVRAALKASNRLRTSLIKDQQLLCSSNQNRRFKL